MHYTMTVYHPDGYRTSVSPCISDDEGVARGEAAAHAKKNPGSTVHLSAHNEAGWTTLIASFKPEDECEEAFAEVAKDLEEDA